MEMQFNRMLPVNADYDVIVAGGGPAGCAAAAASARTGAKTLLLETAGALGGMGTIGLVPAWCPFSDQEKIIYKGIAEEVFQKTKEAMPHIKKDAMDWVSIDAEALKRIYDDLVTEAGCDVLFNTMVSAVERENNSITHIITSNKNGLTAYAAKIFVDCTGDADLIAWADGEFEYGDEVGEVQAVTHCFQLSNVDQYAYQNNPLMHSSRLDCPVYDIVRSEQYPLVQDGHSCNCLVGAGTVGFNAGHMWSVHSTDPFSVSKALMEGRRLADQFHRGLQEFYPSAFSSSYLSATAPAMGIRESRRVLGDYYLTVEDYMARRSFPDEVGRNCYYIDIHKSKTEREKELAGAAIRKDHIDYAPGESHGIPYRCLIPRGLDNVLTAGRNVSCDRQVLGSIRVMPPALVTGQAAGTAAALAALGNTGTRGVDVEALRNTLRADGAYFE